MCGISGIFAYGAAAPPVSSEELELVGEALRRRGPDDMENWRDPGGRIGLGHRRLAIIDVSPAGHQPMTLDGGRLRITFNGEIYNYRELRAELQAAGCVLRSQSDTEVLLHLYDRHGVAMLGRLRGMFAFAIWDAARRSLLLARDPLGIKPLYLSDDGATVRFASQAKALLAGGNIDRGQDPAATIGFLVWGAVPEPMTFWKHIECLPAGHAVLFDGTSRRLIRHHDVAGALGVPAAPWRQEQIVDYLRESVRYHMVADVPVGVFLSSGVDSIALACEARKHSQGPLTTVNIGFDQYDGSVQDETAIAEQAARAMGAKFHHWRISRRDFESERDSIMAAMDQPTIDGVNTYFVSKAAAQAGLKVALSGVGGDEVFGGYPSFRQIPAIVGAAGWLPGLSLAGRGLRRLMAPWIGRLTSPKYASLVELSGNVGDAYLLRRGLYLPWELPGIVDRDVLAAALPRLSSVLAPQDQINGIGDRYAQVAALEMSLYLRNQLLRDTDWASMHHSLEVRTPFVDVKLFAQLAPHLVGAAKPSKAELIAMVEPPLRPLLANRPKLGFQVPIREWLNAGSDPAGKRRGLRGWAARVLEAFDSPFIVGHA